MTCRGCEQTRQLFFHVWRKVKRNRPTCVVKGCTGAPPICAVHWKALPVVLRKRWWRETNYNNEPPPKILIDEVNRAIIEAKKQQ